MTQDEKLKVYRAQVANLRMLDQAWVQQVRSINQLLVKDQKTAVDLASRQLALLYCAYAECAFSKVIHTPYGFSSPHILQIKKAILDAGITAGWHKALDLGLRRIVTKRENKEISDIRKKVQGIIKHYIEGPSVLRNKIAHGQWAMALNRQNDKVNCELTRELDAINVVTLTRWRDASQRLAAILELLIESPNRAFRPSYYFEIQKHAEALKASEGWSIERRVAQLKLKRSFAKQVSHIVPGEA
ncbi:hypothetical protein PQR02_00145 [Paraburkholderia sediminicola]|uniref:Uncharacterized protein n=1 Tax=Paraburkholderia rhynchosiae TaxID=487049 RepID=A0ACC7NDU0_9BURK